jgi:hypothetical protein
MNHEIANGSKYLVLSLNCISLSFMDSRSSSSFSKRRWFILLKRRKEEAKKKEKRGKG